MNTRVFSILCSMLILVMNIVGTCLFGSDGSNAFPEITNASIVVSGVTMVGCLFLGFGFKSLLQSTRESYLFGMILISLGVAAAHMCMLVALLMPMCCGVG